LKSLETQSLGYSALVRRKSSTNLNTSPEKTNKLPHTPVLVHQVADFLQPENSNIILDATFGAGGHTKELLKRSKSVRILCLDRDPVAFDYAAELQRAYPDQVVPLHGKFSDLPNLLRTHGCKQNSLDGILFDFGCSSMQFDSETRGFASRKDAPLDMRMDGPNGDGITAADVLAHASETDLHQIFKTYGGELNSKKIARAIVEMRQSRRLLRRTSELRDFVESLFNENYRFDNSGKYTHISTKIFLALRAFVNNEMNEISYAMLIAHRYLKIGGIMVTISLHPLEDKIVKDCVTGELNSPVGTQLPLHFFSYNTVFDKSFIENLTDAKWKLLTKHVIVPDKYEMSMNPRSKSAKLRACMKIA
jgi:receptor-type tyrosine-protein phosphatase gamma